MKRRPLLRTLILIAAAAFLTMATAGCRGNPVINSVQFSCDRNAMLKATFYRNRRVELELGNGRSVTLPQAVSADGARFADRGESLVFWTKGNGATLGLPDGTVSKCILVAQDPGGLPNVFASTTLGVSVRYPDGWKVDDSYQYVALGPQENIPGVAIRASDSLTKGTNLSEDTALSIETVAKPSGAGSAALNFLPEGASNLGTVTRDGVTYSVASMEDAGAGNRYEETVYAIPGTRPLVGIRYFIHYSVYENYPAGTITRFDRAKLVAALDAMRGTVIIDQSP